MLTQQYRMAPPIRELVSTYFYDGVLEDGDCPRDGKLALLDTSRSGASMTTRYVRLRPSKVNLVHRTVVSVVVESIVKTSPQASILVLSPFLAQRRAYEAESRSRRWKNVRFATVHASQGTEADVVILDTVLAPGRARPRFLDDLRTPELPNMLNVGLSRAKRGLIVVAHREAIREKLPGRLLERIVDYLAGGGHEVDLPDDLQITRQMRNLAATLMASE
jgi:superfamily I DNA and/or RNA helicase